RQELLQSSLNERLTQLDRRFVSFQGQSEEKLENIRNSVEIKLNSIQESNAKKLDEMRATVDEKLQKTLNERLAQSFSQVSDRLEQVYKGLGEMQTLAIGVGDLKKVLSNVKTRGILGEIQLGAILEQILSPEQYSVNVATKKGSTAVVEFAVKLPGDGNEPVYLPIDSKFPGDRYQCLMDAYDSGDKEAVTAASKELERALKLSAKDIHDKYIDTPYTTDFGIMFLPFEGLYAEAIRMGMVEILSRDYKINIAGPTTMAALLNSLQMGFRTLAIQRRSGEVWEILGAVKTEFSKFSDILETARTKLRRANDDLDSLIGTRTRAIQRKLKEVTQLTSDDSLRLLEITENTEGDSDDN
ncbi:MAG: DNA recombination protein RmuC, partial [Oscillospiraceae bacterium]